jgi:hypothetical protein
MVHQKELIPYLANVPLEKAFNCSKAEIEGLADVLVAKAEERLREAEVSINETRLVNANIVYDEWDAMDEEERADFSDDEIGEVNPHLYIESGGVTFHLWGEFFCRDGSYFGQFSGLERLKPPREVVKMTWGDVFDRAGVCASPAFESFTKIATCDEVRRAVPAVNTLKNVDPFLRPDCLPFLRMPSGDNLCMRFDKKTGEICDYLLVMHDELLAYPMGHDLAAVIKYQGRTIGEELGALWEALADQIAEDGAESFDEFCAAVDLMYSWDHWKFKLDKDVSANGEELCREWLEKWQALDSPVLRKNSGCQTITAFAAARVGETQRAVDAAVEALRLPAREGDPRRRALALLGELGEEVPADMQTLCECVRSSEKAEEVQRNLAAAAQKRTEAGDHAGAYELLIRACFDCEAIETSELLGKLLEAARSAGFGPVTQVLQERLANPS